MFNCGLIFDIAAVNRHIRADISFTVRLLAAFQSLTNKPRPSQNFFESLKATRNEFVRLIGFYLFKIDGIRTNQTRIYFFNKIISQFYGFRFGNRAIENTRRQIVREPLILV